MFMMSMVRGSARRNGFLFLMTVLFSFLTIPAHASTGSLTLVSQPSNMAVTEGDSAAFTVSATSSRRILYTWYKNGKFLWHFGPTLSTSSVSPAHAGTYSCRMTDGRSIVNCAPFTLTVRAKADVEPAPAPVPEPTPEPAPAPEPTPVPTSDLTLVNQPSSSSIYEGSSVTFSLSATSSQSFNISWLKNGTVIGSGNSLTISNATLNNAGSYSCRVSDAIRSIDCNSFSLSVNQIVRITQQPSSLMIDEGSSASLSVTATGTAPISYQWYRNGSAISGATGNTLSLATTAGTDAGDYFCRVSNPGSSANSATATLSIVAVVKTGSALISWQAPTTRADGSALTAADIAGYELFYSEDGTSMSKLTSLSAGELSVQVDDLAAGTHYFALATKDVNGMQSALSSTISVTIK